MTDLTDFLKNLGNELRTQDNRITANPLFCVKQKRRIYGLEAAYANEYVWLDAENAYEIADDKETERLDELEEDYKDTGQWVKTYYTEYWDFVTAHFTKKAAQRYIDENNHNLNEPRIYVTSQYRCDEFNKLMEHLASTK